MHKSIDLKRDTHQIWFPVETREESDIESDDFPPQFENDVLINEHVTPDENVLSIDHSYILMRKQLEMSIDIQYNSKKNKDDIHAKTAAAIKIHYDDFKKYAKFLRSVADILDECVVKNGEEFIGYGINVVVAKPSAKGKGKVAKTPALKASKTTIGHEIKPKQMLIKKK